VQMPGKAAIGGSECSDTHGSVSFGW
jgi:hypothetical protein